MTASPCTSEDFNTPLARRLVKKYFSPATGAGSASKGKDNDSLRRRLVGCSPELQRKASTSKAVNNDKSDAEAIANLPSKAAQTNTEKQGEEESEAEEIADLANCSSGISGIEVLAKRNSSNISTNNSARESIKPKSNEKRKKTRSNSKSGVKGLKTSGRKRKTSCERSDKAQPDDGSLPAEVVFCNKNA